MVKKKPKKTEEPGSTEEQLRKAQEELEYLRAENAYLKKLKALVQERQARERGKKPKQ
jgi:transposase